MDGFMGTEVKIVCVDDEKNVLRALKRLFLDDEYEIITAESGEEGLEVIAANAPVQVVISDYRMPVMNGVDFLKEVYKRWPDTIRIVLSGYADTAAVVAAINEGKIYKFIPKPWNDDELKITLSKAIEAFFLKQHNEELTSQLRESNDELKALNENLEEMVRNRTEELQFRNNVLVRSQAILDLLPVGVLGLDKDACIMQSNKMMGVISGLDCGMMLANKAELALPGEFHGLVRAVFSGETVTDTFTLEGQKILVKGVTLNNEFGQSGKILVFIPESAE
ncbi:MAG: response regulator [Proteobacteria bacterium]|nr:response regulator [Pseudomonadota bacterium]MBU1688433.1 response regulator [Pseudomonadota bacterium]